MPQKTGFDPRYPLWALLPPKKNGRGDRLVVNSYTTMYLLVDLGDTMIVQSLVLTEPQKLLVEKDLASVSGRQEAASQPLSTRGCRLSGLLGLAVPITTVGCLDLLQLLLQLRLCQQDFFGLLVLWMKKGSN